MATYTGTCGKYSIILNVSEVSSSVDVSSNTSKVSWSLQFRADTAYCQWNPGPGDFEVKINGASVWSAQNPSLWFNGSGQTLTLASGTSGAITHNSDGAKTVSCQAIYTQNSTANYLPSSGSCSGNLKLSTIPRASSFSSITGNVIGESQTINIDRKSSNFTNNLWYRVGDEDWVPIGTGIETSKTWTLPTSLNNKIPNATSLTLTYLLRTYNGNTQIGGDVTYNFNVNYSGEKPTAGSVSIAYTNLFNNKFIANYSSATIKYGGYAGVYSSSIKSAQVILNGSWKGTTNYNTGKLTSGTHTYQGVVTDSRGNTSYTGQQSFTCYQINNPTVSINAYRSDSSGNANPSGTYITIIPTYSAHDPVGGNSIKNNSFTCTSLMTTGTAIGSGSKKILSNAAVDSEYVISGTVTDKLGRSSATSIKVGTAFALWDVRPDQRGMAFGKYSTGVDKFEVAWPAYFDNILNVTGDVRVGSTFGAGEGTTPGVALHSADGGIELSGSTPYIDFHYNNSSSDYTYRIIGDADGLKMVSPYSDSHPDDILTTNKAFPVGAVYVTVNDTNPGTFLGGTWVQFGQGRTLVGVNTSETEFDTVEKTGGEATHKLTKSEIPNYKIGGIPEAVPGNHDKWSNGGITGGNLGNASSSKKGVANNNDVLTITSGPQWSYSIRTDGGGQPHNNLQPYITVYFWKRTA